MKTFRNTASVFERSKVQALLTRRDVPPAVFAIIPVVTFVIRSGHRPDVFPYRIRSENKSTRTGRVVI